MRGYRKDLGLLGESIAAFEYAKLGYCLLGRNLRVHGLRQIGEIDLLVKHKNQLVFVEVKTRTSEKFGTGAESVDYWKQRRLVKTAKMLMAKRLDWAELVWRFDVVQVDIDKNRHRATIFRNVIEDFD
jgi:putative endonuclease